jgi:coatomer subunit beta'
MLASLFSGHVVIWNYNTSTAVKSFEVTELPVRSGKFIPRKQWIVTGSDDMTIRAFNVNTQERVTEVRGGQPAALRCCRHLR